ncbi:hypothetical protein Aph01nite_05500 [Acrocarpospora phusangensis]|uniref:Uncharacterized protein n=1 Tax=Acrocarpospora phusangensis TaxID=1070424 RepID=A0A919Q8N9_9ACTN|nr:hypothetical protein [Acrocarpospora phusangensis]GIH22240.1 hypothetical protein Aph01nite_05500 [Acrocarpospora phusangensis]
MQIVRVDLGRGEIGAQWTLPTGAFADLVWAHSRQDEALEHLRVHTAPDRIEIVLFLCVPKRKCAEETAQRICSRVVQLVPGLQGWFVRTPW